MLAEIEHGAVGRVVDATPRYAYYITMCPSRNGLAGLPFEQL